MQNKNIELAAATTGDPRWASIVARDSKADGAFYYSVRTTGVYCRPSCGARLARPENVQFYPTRAEAERAGFRPCKRCKPDRFSPAEEQAQMIAEACRFIEEAEETPTLAQLSDQAGVSAYHFHRLFKTATGLTPKEYAAAQRDKRVRTSLDQ